MSHDVSPQSRPFRSPRTLVIAAAGLLLAACAQAPQSAGDRSARADDGVSAAAAAAFDRPPGRLASCTQRAEVTPFARRLLDELNLLRTQPAQYADLVEAKFRSVDASGIYEHEGLRRQLKEGRAVVDETVRLLRSLPPRPPLRMASCLSRAAADHAADRGPKGLLGHVGSDGSMPWERVQRYAAPVLQCGDYLSYTYDQPRDIVIQYLVDDGVPSRGHRAGILDPNQRSFGAALGMHARWQTMAVLMLCREDVRDV